MDAADEDLQDERGRFGTKLAEWISIVDVVADVQEDLVPEVKAANGLLEIDTVDATVPSHQPPKASMGFRKASS